MEKLYIILLEIQINITDLIIKYMEVDLLNIIKLIISMLDMNPDFFVDIFISLINIFVIVLSVLIEEVRNMYNNMLEDDNKKDNDEESDNEENDGCEGNEHEDINETNYDNKENDGKYNNDDDDDNKKNKGKEKATEEQEEEWAKESEKTNRDFYENNDYEDYNKAQINFDENLAKKLQSEEYEYREENYNIDTDPSSYSVISSEFNEYDDNERANKKLDIKELEAKLRDEKVEYDKTILGKRKYNEEDENSSKRNK